MGQIEILFYLQASSITWQSYHGLLIEVHDMDQLDIFFLTSAKVQRPKNFFCFLNLLVRLMFSLSSSLWWFFIGFYSFIFFLKLVISCWYLLLFNKLIVELFLGRMALCFVFRFAGLSDLNLSLFCWVCSCRGLLCFLFQLYFCWRLVFVHSLGFFYLGSLSVVRISLLLTWHFWLRISVYIWIK